MTVRSRRFAFAILAAQVGLIFALGCDEERNPDYELTACSPKEISTKGGKVEIAGRHFYNEVTIDLNSDEPPVVDDTWTVAIGNKALPGGAVQRKSTNMLTVEVPAGLEPGVKDVTVTSPRKVSARPMAKCLTILDESVLSLTIESAPDGSGSEIENQVLALGQQLRLYAVARRASQVATDDGVQWELNGTAGSISSYTGSSIVFTATSSGVSTIAAAHGLYGRDTTKISVVTCTRDAECQERICSSAVRCVNQVCVAGEVDKDSDGDGFIDMNCPGGDDCDDDSSFTYTGAAFNEDAAACMKDADSDGYGDKNPKTGVVAGTDCADTPGTDPACENQDGWRCNPGWVGVDQCDGADNDCDGLTDEDPDFSWYPADDDDGCGDVSKVIKACSPPQGYVADCAKPSLTIESAPEGTGSEIENEVLTVGQELVLYAVARRASKVVPNEIVFWEIGGSSGNISSNSGSFIVFTATSLGLSTIAATHESYGSDTTTISVVSCTRDSECQATSCSSAVRCVDQACVAGEVDKDGDGDGFIDIYCPGGDDCDDLSPVTYTGAGYKDNAAACMKDDDGDGYGDKSPYEGVTAGTDCADTRLADPACNNLDGSRCNPGWTNSDLCDGADNDCDGSTDEDPERTWYADADGDSYGNSVHTVKACVQPGGYVADPTDCDDTPASCGNQCLPAVSEAIFANSCTDGFDNDCDGKVDIADSDCLTPPRAVFRVTPSADGTGKPFTVDASASSDLEDASDKLRVRWDWESNGTWDTDFTTGKTASHVYYTTGTYSITLEVMDTTGASNITTRIVVVTSNIITVNTATDESVAPGTGTSLREAIFLSNTVANKHAIVFSQPMTIILKSSLGILPAISYDVDIVDNGSVVVDGSAVSFADYCLAVSNGTVTVAGLELQNCQNGIEISSGATPKATIRDCNIHNNIQIGILIDNQPGQVVGPGNRLASNGISGIIAYRSGSSSTIIRGNAVHDNGEIGIALYTPYYNGDGPDNNLVELNAIWHNTSHGIYLSRNSDNNIIRHNTFAYNGTSGLTLQNDTCNGNDVRNNIFVGNGYYGINAAGSMFAELNYNLFFGNASGPCEACADQPNSVYQDPRFINAASNDFRIRPKSPAVDRGADLGIDVNGSSPGTYNEAAPDIGAFESTP